MLRPPGESCGRSSTLSLCLSSPVLFVVLRSAAFAGACFESSSLQPYWVSSRSPRSSSPHCWTHSPQQSNRCIGSGCTPRSGYQYFPASSAPWYSRDVFSWQRSGGQTMSFTSEQPSNNRVNATVRPCRVGGGGCRPPPLTEPDLWATHSALR